MNGRVAPFIDLENGVVTKNHDLELTEASQLPSRTAQKSVHDNTASNLRRRASGTTGSSRDDIELSLQNLVTTQELPSRSSQRSVHRVGVRRNSARRATIRNDIELLSAIDVVDDLGVEEEIADPKRVTRPMSERRRLRKSIKDREKVVRGLKKNRISKWKEFKMRLAMSWKLTKSSISHWSRDYEVWKGHLKRVEGRFGTGVSSFFVFLKSLLFLNITTFVLEFGLVTLPSVIIENNITSAANTNSCYYDELQTQNKTSFMTVAQQAADFISGKGWINTTVMFYAGYQASMLVSDAGVTYNLPLAYLLVGCSYFVCSLFMVVRSLGTSLRESYVESGGTSTSCSNSIFAAWDFCITDENTAKAKTQTIAQNFRAQFAEEERRIKVQSRTTCGKCGLYTLRTLSSLLVLALLGGAIYAIVFAVAISTDPEYEQKASEAFEGGEKLLLFGPSLVITVLNLVLPFIFDFLSRFEDWSPGFEVNITLFRTVLLRLASLGVLMIKIYAKVDETCEDNPQTCCQQNWENEIASQMYMLIWLDFFSHIFSSLVVTSIRKLLFKYTDCFKKVGLPVFDIPKQVLRLVYGECLIWIGTFFSPVMPAMGVVKLFIIFYVELLAVLLNYRPSKKVYRAARSNHLFTVLLLISFFLCLGTVGWGIAGVRPSCLGPFSNVYCKADARLYDVLQVEISSWPSWIQQIINFVTTLTFIFPILTVVCLLLFYFKSMTTSLLLTIETLKDQLALDGRDKRFLMEKLFRYEMIHGKDADDNLYSSGSVKPKQLNQVNATNKRDSLAPPDNLMSQVKQVNSPKKRDSLAPPGDLMF